MLVGNAPPKTLILEFRTIPRSFTLWRHDRSEYYLSNRTLFWIFRTCIRHHVLAASAALADLSIPSSVVLRNAVVLLVGGIFFVPQICICLRVSLFGLLLVASSLLGGVLCGCIRQHLKRVRCCDGVNAYIHSYIFTRQCLRSECLVVTILAALRLQCMAVA